MHNTVTAYDWDEMPSSKLIMKEDGRLTSALSKNHLFSPVAGSTSLHHLKPTSRRPDTFLTVQKSAADSNTHVTNTMTKSDVNHEHSIYVKIQAACSNSEYEYEHIGDLRHLLWRRHEKNRSLGEEVRVPYQNWIHLQVRGMSIMVYNFCNVCRAGRKVNVKQVWERLVKPS